MLSVRAYGCLLDSLQRETNCAAEGNIICPFNELNLKNFFQGKGTEVLLKGFVDHSCQPTPLLAGERCQAQLFVSLL